ncbi:hypothetical protein ACXJJ3_27765 [Kribbella sp. WER1]
MTPSSRTPLSGDSAVLVIRALLDFRSLWTTHDLVTTAGVDAATIRALIAHLEQEELVERHTQGVVSVPNWLTLLHRWNKDFRFSDCALTSWRTKPGAPPLLDRIADSPVRHALTGTRAAQHWAPETPNGPTVIYTPNAEAAANTWELIPATRRTIVLAEPPSDVVYTRTRKTTTGLRLAAPSQVLSDLLTGAARSPKVAEALTHWMLDHELDWRY